LSSVTPWLPINRNWLVTDSQPVEDGTTDAAWCEPNPQATAPRKRAGVLLANAGVALRLRKLCQLSAPRLHFSWIHGHTRLKESIKALFRDATGSLRDLLPVVLVIAVFQLLVIRQPVEGLLSIFAGAALVVAGLTFFVFGLRLALFPIGEGLGHALAAKGSVFWLVVFAFALGFGTTIAEPALIAVASEAANIAAEAGVIVDSTEAKTDYAVGLRITVALAVGAALVIGVIRIVTNWSLPLMIIGGYILVVALTGLAPPEIIGIAYDSGGVTTSTVTVPLVTALGVGLASSLKDRNPLLDGFGLIAFASLFPILSVMSYAQLADFRARVAKRRRRDSTQ
jgi:hypothetical protein